MERSTGSHPIYSFRVIGNYHFAKFQKSLTDFCSQFMHLIQKITIYITSTIIKWVIMTLNYQCTAKKLTIYLSILLWVDWRTDRRTKSLSAIQVKIHLETTSRLDTNPAIKLNIFHVLVSYLMKFCILSCIKEWYMVYSLCLSNITLFD